MKKNIALLLVGVLTLGLVGCGNSTAETTTETTTEKATTEEVATDEAAEVATNGETYELKLGHIQTVDHPLGQAAEYFADLVSEKTNGAVTVSIFPASQLGSEKEIFDAVDIGSIDFAMLGYGEPANKFTNLGIFDAPYLATSRDQIVNMLNSDETFALFDEMTEYMNVKGLCGLYYGARYLTTGDTEVRTPEDLAGINIRVPDQPMYIDTLTAMGSVATPMSYSEIYLALQQGVVDGNECPLSSIASGKFNEAQTYLIKTEHIMGTQALYASTKTLDSLPAEYVTAIEEAALETVPYSNELHYADEDLQLELLQESGMILIDDVDKEAFQEAVSDIYDIFDPELVEAFRSIE